MTRLRSALVVVSMLIPAPGTAQSAACDAGTALRSEPTFLACARAGTEKYHDQAVAVLDGYRRIGRDFPAMGEHWIRVALLFDGKVDPSRPEVLTYAVVAGKPELLGVAYALPLLKGERAPDNLPGGAAAWHDHSRTIEDETVLPMHHTSAGPDAGARLAMMHAWIWTPNPDGIFAADNWAVPYIRLALRPNAAVSASSAPSSAVARALSLASGGREYFELAIEAAAEPTAAERAHIRSTLDRAEAEVQSVVRDIRGPEVDEPLRTRLAAVWTALWTQIDRSLNAASRRRVADLPVR